MHAFIVLLGALVLYCCTLEVVTQAGFSRISRVQRRITSSKEEALALRPTTPQGAKTILIVGNSLVVRGIESTKLRQDMAPEYQTSVFAIENTRYLDWYFGMRRFFAEGSHPAILVLCLANRQLISNSTDGEYFAYYMMQERDILGVKREARLDMTTASNYFFARTSAWLGSRSSIRNWLLGELMPNIEQLTEYLPEKVPPMPATDVVVEEGLRRLEVLQTLCASHGTRFILLIPPSLSTDDRSNELLTAAERTGIKVLLPFRATEMPASNFDDGFHMNSQGATAFTSRLSKALRNENPGN
jgi:hypothetical protein